MNPNVDESPAVPNDSQQRVNDWVFRHATAPPPSTAGTIAPHDQDIDIIEEGTPILATRQEAPADTPRRPFHSTNRLARSFGNALSAVGWSLAAIGTCLLGAALGLLVLALACAAFFAFPYGAYWSTIHAESWSLHRWGDSTYGVIGGLAGLVIYVIGVSLTFVFCAVFCRSCCCDD